MTKLSIKVSQEHGKLDNTKLTNKELTQLQIAIYKGIILESVTERELRNEITSELNTRTKKNKL